ncbi:PadR family transcriptional regulator [Paenibacillus sp. MBLB4367]|uniref:PadR family transcriptional regulator n=1 Tax=Paenibacillus sp. MBLB4367 TaxID=3384767 RepID=UPI0039080AB7
MKGLSIKLAILGLLMEADSHPYEIRQKMKERAMDQYMKIQDGSLYYAIDQLKKEGSVTVVDVIREGSRPDKTIYRITDKGKTKFEKLLLDQFKEGVKVNNPLYAAVVFSRHADSKLIARKLEEHIIEVEAYTVRMKGVYEEHVGTVPRSTLHLMWGLYDHARTELKWLKRLYEDTKAGRLGEFGKGLDVE